MCVDVVCLSLYVFVLCFVCVVCMCIICTYMCMSRLCSLQRYSEVDCTICGKEYNLNFGETDAEVTKKLAV